MVSFLDYCTFMNLRKQNVKKCESLLSGWPGRLEAADQGLVAIRVRSLMEPRTVQKGCSSVPRQPIFGSFFGGQTGLTESVLMAHLEPWEKWSASREVRFGL